jgi:hypothetical protein
MFETYSRDILMISATIISGHIADSTTPTGLSRFCRAGTPYATWEERGHPEIFVAAFKGRVVYHTHTDFGPYAFTVVVKLQGPKRRYYEKWEHATRGLTGMASRPRRKLTCMHHELTAEEVRSSAMNEPKTDGLVLQPPHLKVDPKVRTVQTPATSAIQTTHRTVTIGTGDGLL